MDSMLRFYNTMTKKKEIFKPLHKGEVKMYNCGPTVYDYAHIGNFRAYVFADIIKRYLEYKGYKVKQIMNITDVGHMLHDVDVGQDKMELAAKKEKKTPEQIAEFYTKVFFEDMNTLNIRKAWKYPKATDHIKEMIVIIKKLLKKKYAYEVNGSVYFDVAKFKNYGKLSGNTIKKLKSGASGRVKHNPDKKNQFDFALWIKDPKHIMQWNSPFGRGYPGWHIECSAMSMKYLGETLDIHTGGEDNTFPHHESEIAQSEAANGKTFVRYWMHTRHLLVNNEKMSKSKGNFFTLRDLLEKGHSPKAIRYLLLAAHYRKPMNLTEKELKKARIVVNRLFEFIFNLDTNVKGKYNKDLHEETKKAKQRFESSMDDDLNTPSALAAVFELMNKTNKAIDSKKVSKKNLKEVKKLFKDFDKVLGILGYKKEKLSKEIQGLIKKRDTARKKKDYKMSDSIRIELRKKGYEIQDTKQGTKVWKRL